MHYPFPTPYPFLVLVPKTFSNPLTDQYVLPANVRKAVDVVHIRTLVSPGTATRAMSLDDLLPALSLLATLRTAAETRHVAELVVRLRTLRAYATHRPGEAADVRSVRHFDALTTLARVRRLLHRIHQRLMSLYPDVSGALVERARLLHKRARSIQNEDANVPPDFLDDALQLTDALETV
ncbi:MAG: hypothetical protein BRD45_03210 [Bacteroidetes bacterium QS_8_64_10]|nr:MAG: hypothetical protein BRD45_03210 [Bacteroidetes bacterium QS_8_64_10]